MSNQQDPAAASAPRVINVVATRFSFEPSRIEVTEGDLNARLVTAKNLNGARGDIGLITAGRDIILDADVDGTITRIAAGRHIGDRLNNDDPKELDIDGDGQADDALGETDIDGDGKKDDAATETDIATDRMAGRMTAEARHSFMVRIDMRWPPWLLPLNAIGQL